MIVPIAIVGLVVIAIVVNTRGTTPSTPSTPVAQEVSPTTTAPVTGTAPATVAVSGNVDDMVGVLTKEADGDASLASSVAGSASTVKNDTQEVNSLTTAYDETTF